jgi:hypothetical protein
MNHLQKPKNESMCDTGKKDARIKDYRKIAKKYIVVDAGSVCNVLHELRSSSLDLQGHNMNRNRENKKQTSRKTSS